jgi:hypothetical protein
VPARGFGITHRGDQSVHGHLESGVAGDHDVEGRPADRRQQPPVPRNAVEIDVKGLEQRHQPVHVGVAEPGE